MLFFRGPAHGAGDKTQTARIHIRSLVIKPGIEKCVETATNALLKTSSGPIQFSHESRKIEVGDIWVWMNGEAMLEDEGWTILEADANLVILPLTDTGSVLRTTAPIKTVVLDPGHGGEDSGAIGSSGTNEKALVLDIANRTKKLLEDSGFQVKLTRGVDAYVELKQRTDLAEDWHADLFVSIHLNWAPNLLASGLETFVLPAPGQVSTLNGKDSTKARKGNKHDSESLAIASIIHSDILKETGSSDRGIKHARFDVLCAAPCPAILLECGFLSNLPEEQNLLSPDFREKIARGISNGIINCSKKPPN